MTLSYKFNHTKHSKFIQKMSLIHRLFPEVSLGRVDPYNDFIADVLAPGRPLAFQPAMDLIENTDNYVVKANIPGFSKDQIEINATGSVLTIKGHYEKSEEKKEENHIKKERVESSFQRSVSLPLTIVADKIKASIKDGVLEVCVPKEAPKSNRIAIE